MSKAIERQYRHRQGNGLLARLLLPIECLGCGQETDWICTDCQRELVVTRPTICVICGKAGTDGLCDQCRRETGLAGAVSFFPYYYPPVQRLVRAVKFAGQFDGLLFFAEQFGNQLLKRIPDSSWVLTPVPLSKERQRQRGFNQAQLLAEHLSKQSQWPIWLGLKRTRHTAAQAELNAKERAKNMRGAFAIVGEKLRHQSF